MKRAQIAGFSAVTAARMALCWPDENPSTANLGAEQALKLLSDAIVIKPAKISCGTWFEAFSLSFVSGTESQR